MVMSRLNSITLKQHKDGQIEVRRVNISDKFYNEDPLLKISIKKEMAQILRDNNIKVFEDDGIIQVEEGEDDDF